jgi:hypothetical protein
MPTWKDVTEIGLALPQTEISTWYRTPGMKVAGKGFLRLRTEAEGGLVVFCDLDKKATLLRSADPTYYTTPHYDGYGAILINLKTVARADLEHLITESWRQRAPLKLLKEFDLRPESVKTPTRPERGTRTRRPPARKGS